MIGALALFIQLAVAGDLDPVLAPHAAKHREEIDKILRKAEEAERLARDAYVVALDSAEVELIAKKDAVGAALIAAERKIAVRISATAADKADLPQKVQAPRKALIKALAKIQDDVVASARKPNAAYLAVLNAVPASADKIELTKQVTAEKKRMLMGIGTVLNLQTDLAGTVWRRVDNNKILQIFTPDKTWEDTTWVAETADRLKFGSGAKLTLAEGGNMLLDQDGKPNMILERGRSSQAAK